MVRASTNLPAATMGPMVWELEGPIPILKMSNMLMAMVHPTIVREIRRAKTQSPSLIGTFLSISSVHFMVMESWQILR
jgi:hypothetical protein